MRAALTITAKDLKERLRDRSAIIQAIAVPLGLAFIMNLTLGPITDQAFSTDVAVADADGGALSEAFSGMLSEVEEAGFITVAAVPDAAAARAMIDADEVSTAYLVPEGFSVAVEMNQDAASRS